MCIRGSACASFFSFLLLLLPCSNFFSSFFSFFFLFFLVYLPGPLPSPIHHRVVIPRVPSPLSMPPLLSSFFPFIFLSARFYPPLSLSLSLSVSIASRPLLALYSSPSFSLRTFLVVSLTSMRVFRSKGCVPRVLLSFGRSARSSLLSLSPEVYKSRGKSPGYRYRGV